MISLNLTSNSIIVEGHSSIEICSAISCLTQTLHLTLNKYNIEHIFICKSGYTKIECNVNNNNIKIMFDLVITGLLDLAITYPNEINISPCPRDL